jgi:adenylate kinase family enzyme
MDAAANVRHFSATSKGIARVQPRISALTNAAQRSSRVRLAELGTRICILGPSNSGKSTLAASIARALDLEAVHLDQLFHLPDSDWRPRPEDEFLALHAQAIARDRWVMDGNYTKCLPQRMARATGLILLEVSTLTSLLRYVRRTLLQRARHGGLAGGRDSIKWDMIRHIVVTTRGDRSRHAEMFQRIGIPKLHLASLREIAAFYRTEQLPRRLP